MSAFTLAALIFTAVFHKNSINPEDVSISHEKNSGTTDISSSVKVRSGALLDDNEALDPLIMGIPQLYIPNPIADIAILDTPGKIILLTNGKLHDFIYLVDMV